MKQRSMVMSCVLAVAIAGIPSARAVFLQQETTPGAAAGVPTPASSENAQSEPSKSGVAEDEKKAPHQAKKNNVKKKTLAVPRVRRHASHARRKAAAQPPSDGEPRKIVVRQGGAQEPSAQIVPGMLPGEAAKQRQGAEEMLVSADDRLKQLAGRTLDAARQETVAQIRNYMEKARSALNDGDTQRGHTLALKAYLLADDLVKH